MNAFFEDVLAEVAKVDEVTEAVAMAAVRVAYMQGHEDAVDGKPPLTKELS